MATHIFVGPTLAGRDISNIAPGAVVHPPVAHGDLLRLDLLGGDVVVIVDGYYHQSASVRHKEVLALYEVIERDAVIRRISGMPVEYIEPASVADPSCAELIQRIADAGATLRITRVPSRFDVPCFGATVWSPEVPGVCVGWGAHLDAGVAVSRAVTEAVQSRLTMICR